MKIEIGRLRLTLCAAVAVGALLVGCDNKSSATTTSSPAAQSAPGTPSAAAVATTASPASPSGGKCAAGEFGDADGVFCVALPAGYKQGEKKTESLGDGTRVTYFCPSKEDAFNVYIDIHYDPDPTGADYAAKSSFSAQSGVAYEEKGATTKGTGKYRKFLLNDKDEHLETHFRSGQFHVTVDCQAHAGKKLTPEVIDACKAAHAP